MVFCILSVKPTQKYIHILVQYENTTQLCEDLQIRIYIYKNKTCNWETQTQRLVGFFLSARNCNYWQSIVTICQQIYTNGAIY
jgi:hypothetical protein